MSGSGVHINLGGLAGLGVALLGLTLASEHFGGDWILTTFSLWTGVSSVIVAFILKIDAYYLSREAYKRDNHL